VDVVQKSGQARIFWSTNSSPGPDACAATVGVVSEANRTHS